MSVIWLLSSVNHDVINCSTKKNLRGIMLNVPFSDLHYLNLLRHGFFSYMTIEVSTYMYLSDTFVNRCQSVLMISVYVWKIVLLAFEGREMETWEWSCLQSRRSAQGEEVPPSEALFWYSYWPAWILGSSALSRIIKCIGEKRSSVPLIACFLLEAWFF